MLYNGDLMWR